MPILGATATTPAVTELVSGQKSSLGCSIPNSLTVQNIVSVTTSLTMLDICPGVDQTLMVVLALLQLI